MASKKQSKMPLRKNYKSDKAFENAMLKYMIKLEPEMFGFKVTQREQMNKGGMMKKKGYAKGGAMKKKGYAKGGAMKKKGYAMGGMMPTQERKINPTTGMTMKKGGMIDMRKSGMFFKGGVIKKSRKR
tara:strand:+ start:307 stop:690 length:384 start_codon:yes stop_codon:yes gene_type:complete